ncbi:MAG: hypothetical protein O9267_13265 [Flavobacterium sp.]|uniref:hypothetical protein n=1 Tax=Flavobacterium sp. TaxID=239 RepID=UPI0022C1B987|nr:hypothetical protein [Flavobacterium sp.]MCZ8198566.1 hypothetical protein [Flavobacterium sp.]
MKNFDIESLVNPEIVEGAFIYHDNEIFEVIDMDINQITIINKISGKKNISDKDWSPIELNEDWLNRFNLKVGSKIRNKTTDLDWIIKSTGNLYYTSIYVEPPYGDNPVIGLKFVHELQAWYFRLTHENIKLNKKLC